MISIHSECLLYDLRCVLSAVRQHNSQLCSSDLEGAERLLSNLIEVIEDATTFIQALQAAAEAQAGLGS